MAFLFLAVSFAAPASAAEPDEEPHAPLGASEPASETDPTEEDPDAALLLELDAADEPVLHGSADFAERDPLEPVNRGMFGVNRKFDHWFFEPVARFYGWLVPDPGKRAVNRFFDNLNEPVVMVNDLLQLRGCRALESGGRFVVNSTVGIAGLLDVATPLGIQAHQSDFGQTLGRMGLGSGAYLVLPLLGPSSLRDAFGQIVDVALRPDTWLLTPAGRLALYSAGGVARREALLVELEELERSAVDYYAALRSAYLMSRERVLQEDGR